MSITFSVIDNAGKITKENQRVNRVILDEDVLSHISAIEQFALGIAEGE